MLLFFAEPHAFSEFCDNAPGEVDLTSTLAYPTAAFVVGVQEPDDTSRFIVFPVSLENLVNVGYMAVEHLRTQQLGKEAASGQVVQEAVTT